MIGFSIEFKKWYVVLRGPRGKVYLATGFAKRIPIFTPVGTYSINRYLDDSYSAILADEWGDEEDDQELLDQLKNIR
jgi:hypothetical protein